jgi:hypothetical protein
VSSSSTVAIAAMLTRVTKRPHRPPPRVARRTIGAMLRLASWIRPAGGSPAPVSAGAPGSRPQSRGEIPAAERGVKSLFGGSKRVGWDCSLVTSTIREPSRSCHGEGHVRQSHSRIGLGGSLRGRETCTRARSDHGTRETRLTSLVSKDRSYKPKAKSSGGQRESDGVVVVEIGVQNNAPGAKDPDFDRACVGRERQGMPARLRRANHPGGRMPAEPSASEMAMFATCRGHALARQRCRLWAAAKRPHRPSSGAKQSCRGDSPRAASRRWPCAGCVAASGRSSVSRVRENRTHGLKGESGNGLA